MAVTVAQLKETEISTCEGKGQTELTTLSLWFELAELGAGGGEHRSYWAWRMELFKVPSAVWEKGRAEKMARKPSQLTHKSLHFTLVTWLS